MKQHKVEDIYELSPLQQGMLFHCLYSPESAFYFEQVSMRLQGAIDVSTFKRAWNDVVARNAVLRTSFHWDGLEKPLQVVHREVELLVDFFDWGKLSKATRTLQLDDYLKQDRERGLQLAEAPLFRVALFRMAATDFVLLLSFHHILIDGWSLPLIFEEFSIFYEAQRKGKKV